MNILFIINIDMSQNGPSVHLLNDIMDGFKQKKHFITRIERKFGQNSWNIKEREEKREKIITVETLPPKSRSYANRYLDDIKYVIKCYKILKNKKFDAVFLQSCNCAGFHLYWISKKLKCPVFYNVQDIFPLDMVYEGTMGRYNPIYFVFDILQKYAYKKSKSIITISEDMKQTLIKIGVDKEKIKVIYNWAYKENYNLEYDMLVKNKYFTNKKYHVVYAGNIGVAQGVENLISACSYLKENTDIEVIIIGRGSRLDNCKILAQKLELNNIIFLDLAPQYLAQYIYNNADINIVTLAPGIIKTSLPSKTAACYSSKRPVIYCAESDAITIRKLIKGSNFIFQCDPKNPKQLADIILKIKNSKLENKKYCFFENVLFPQSASAYVSLIEERN